jgi:sterol desaturase/sphingolipid hydroxylase (fatty acid hydroxylase superfamily)
VTAWLASRLVDAMFALAALGILLWPLERAFPAVKEQRSIRPHSGLDLCFFLGQQLCFGPLVLRALSWMQVNALRLPLSEVRDLFHAQPYVLRVVELVMLGDLLAYLGHRLQHAWEPLWRLHAVHHSAERLDWLAAHREHPLDGLYTQTLLNLPIALLGLDLAPAAGIVLFRAAWATFIHSNTRVPLGPLRYVLGAPELHHRHHARDRRSTDFGNLAPWTDLLFGTYGGCVTEPIALGLEQPMRASYLAMLLDPLRIALSKPSIAALRHDAGARRGQDRAVPHGGLT